MTRDGDSGIRTGVRKSRKPQKSASSRRKPPADTPAPITGGDPFDLAPFTDAIGIIQRLASIDCTTDEIAFVVGSDRETIEQHFSDDVRRGRAICQLSVRREQFRKAKSGDVEMLIWLGRVMLGQGDGGEKPGHVYDADAPRTAPVPLPLRKCCICGHKQPHDRDDGDGPTLCRELGCPCDFVGAQWV